jgi:hypothetical protein
MNVCSILSTAEGRYAAEEEDIDEDDEDAAAAEEEEATPKPPPRVRNAEGVVTTAAEEEAEDAGQRADEDNNKPREEGERFEEDSPLPLPPLPPPPRLTRRAEEAFLSWRSALECNDVGKLPEDDDEEYITTISKNLLVFSRFRFFFSSSFSLFIVGRCRRGYRSYIRRCTFFSYEIKKRRTLIC